MIRQKRIRAAIAAIERQADEDMLSLPEGRLIMAIIGLAAADMINHAPGGRLYLTCGASHPGSFDWWCRCLRIDSAIAIGIANQHM